MLKRAEQVVGLSDQLGKQLPNWLTAARFLCVPVFVVLLTEPTPVRSLWATLIFVLASFTDWLDGYLARKYDAETPFGALMDPLADKVLVMAALVMLSGVAGDAWVPAWMVVTLLGREMFINGLRAYAAVKGVVVSAGRWAKHKTAWSMLAIVFLLVHEPYQVFGVLIDFSLSGLIFLWIALFFSILSAAIYISQLKGLWASNESC